MKYLVDTNVLSEATRPDPSPRVVQWLRENEKQLAVNPVILGELEYGILLLPAGRRKRRLEKWFREGIQLISILNLDAATASTWASLLARLKKKGWAMSVKDSLIAATALTHELTVATRNIADFRHAGVRLINPFDE